jgi:predicted nucleic-acid-binding protein
MIMVFLDTNIVMRYLLDDHKELSEKARQIIDSKTDLFICDGVCAEIVYVLQKAYLVEPEIIKQTISELLEKENVFVTNKNVVKKSLEIFASESLDYMDCFLCAFNHLEGVAIETFDIKLKKLLKPVQ